MDDITLAYDFGHGFVQNSTTSRVISTFDELVERGSRSSSLMMWSKKKNQWFHFNLGWTAIRLVCTKSQMFALGADGRVLVADAGGTTEEKTGARDDGLEMRDMCLISGVVYVAGAGPRVCKRAGPGNWISWSAGLESECTQEPGDGINAIFGLEETEIFAAGDRGAIWRCRDGRWRRQPSPTELTLNTVRVVRPGLVFAAGQDGVLLRCAADRWETVDHGGTQKEILAIEWFDDRLYLACADELFVLDRDDHLSKARVAPGVHWTFGHLHAKEGSLWSFGKKHIFWTDDGEHWHNVTPTVTVFDPADSGPLPDRSSCCRTGSAHKCD